MPLPPELQEEIKKRIKAGEKILPELKKELEKMKLAGIDVVAQRKELILLEKKLLDLKLQYGK